MTGGAHDPDDGAAPSHGEPGRGSGPAVFGLVALTAGLGIIGMAIGFGTLLGVTATASGGGDTSALGPTLVAGGSSFILGLLLVVSGALLWRAHRSAVVVTWVALILLALSSLARIVMDSIDFASVVGTVLSLVALTGMVALLVSDDVRTHIARGAPLRLR